MKTKNFDRKQYINFTGNSNFGPISEIIDFKLEDYINIYLSDDYIEKIT